MNKTICFFVLITAFFLQTGCKESINPIESIMMDYPHGETRLLIRRNGETMLFYGALPQQQKVKNGIFDIDELYKQLQPRLHENVPREKWPNPKSKAGMVTIIFDNKAKKDYLIFNEETFAKRIFEKAKKNIVDQLP